MKASPGIISLFVTESGRLYQKDGDKESIDYEIHFLSEDSFVIPNLSPDTNYKINKDSPGKISTD